MRKIVFVPVISYFGIGSLIAFIRFVSAIFWISFGPSTGMSSMVDGIYSVTLLMGALSLIFLWPMTLYSVISGHHSFASAIFFPWFADASYLTIQ